MTHVVVADDSPSGMDGTPGWDGWDTRLLGMDADTRLGWMGHFRLGWMGHQAASDCMSEAELPINNFFVTTHTVSVPVTVKVMCQKKRTILHRDRHGFQTQICPSIGPSPFKQCKFYQRSCDGHGDGHV